MDSLIYLLIGICFPIIYLFMNQKNLIYSVSIFAIFLTIISSIFALMGEIFIAILSFILFVGGIVVFLLVGVMLYSEEPKEIIENRFKVFKIFVIASIVFISIFPIFKSSTFTQTKSYGVFPSNLEIIILLLTIVTISFVASLNYFKND